MFPFLQVVCLVAAVVLQTSANDTSDASSTIIALFSNVTTSLAHVYNMVDDQGVEMACVHVQPARSNIWGDDHRYFSLYHAHVGSEYEVRLASSADLIHWRYHRTLLHNADMPYPARLDHGEEEYKDGWIVLAHEQWMNKNSELPSRLGFKLYYNESMLLQGKYFNSYVAPLSVGQHSKLEGTPSFFSPVSLVQRNGYFMIDVSVGFHFNDDRGVDQVATGTLRDFGPTVVQPSFTGQTRADTYNEKFIALGAIGNIGQRGYGTLNGQQLLAQEANIGKMPPTVWEDWRSWLYFYAANEGPIPTGASGSDVTMLDVHTHGGSQAIANPSWTQVPCPDNVGHEQCLFISYFIFSEGSAPGEAGVLAFLQQL